MKLAINLPLAVYWEALGEAVSLVRDAGIAPEKMLEILAVSSGGTNVLKNRAAKLAVALKEAPGQRSASTSTACARTSAPCWRSAPRWVSICR